MLLSQYKTEALDLLRDQVMAFTSDASLTRWINGARTQTAKRTGCIRRLVTGQSAFGASAQPGGIIVGGLQPGATEPNPVANTAGLGAAQGACQTVPGVERYPFIGFFNPILKAQHQGCESIIDVGGCSVNWGGATRPTLNWLPWDDLQAYARAYSTLVTSYPFYWSVMNDGTNGEIWLFPVPSFVGDIELDAYCLPSALYTDDDYDAVPDAFADAVKFRAVSLAFQSSYRYAQAQYMEDQFAERLGIDRVAVDRGKQATYYYTNI